MSKPKHPLYNHAYVRDAGAGAFSLVIGIEEPPSKDGQSRFVSLITKAGTSMDDAMALARALNERLAKVEVIQW